MQICPTHKDKIADALASQGFDPRRDWDAIWQAQSLILQNAIAANPGGLNAPPHVCPLCRMPISQSLHWLSEMAKSIANERKPQS